MRGQKLAYLIMGQNVYQIGLFLSSHLSKFISSMYPSRGCVLSAMKSVFFFVQQDSVSHKLADNGGALPLNNKASYMIKLILVSQS
jgi:hypothetical protein